MNKLPAEIQEDLFEKGADASVLITLLFRYCGYEVKIIENNRLGVEGDRLVKFCKEGKLFDEKFEKGAEFYLEIKGRRMMTSGHNLLENCLGLEEKQFKYYMERYEKRGIKTLYGVVNAERRGFGEGIFFQWAHKLAKKIELARECSFGSLFLNFPIKFYEKLL